ncbi:hypothetical protein LINPERHAP2_LOCUS21774 [Linum perenne]
MWLNLHFQVSVQAQGLNNNSSSRCFGIVVFDRDYTIAQLDWSDSKFQMLFAMQFDRLESGMEGFRKKELFFDLWLISTSLCAGSAGGGDLSSDCCR